MELHDSLLSNKIDKYGVNNFLTCQYRWNKISSRNVCRCSEGLYTVVRTLQRQCHCKVKNGAFTLHYRFF